MTTKDEALQQALVALELSQPARCGQSDEMYEQERQAHRAAALRLAEIFEQYEGTIIDQAEAATELRRLHALNQELLEALNVALSNHIGDANKMVEHPAQRRTDYAVHLHHCNIGEYEGACKYGDPDCPALKPVQHDAEGPINEGWQITVADGHSGYGVYAHMEDYPEEGAVFVMPVEQPAQQQYPLPNDLYASKDWREGSYSERVAWLHTMYEGAKKTLDDYLEQPAQQREPVAEVRRSMTGGNVGLSTYIVQIAEGYYPPGTKLYTSPPPRKPFDVLAVTVAYEQGVGKGHQAYQRKEEIETPYTPGDCNQAWTLGYKEGQAQAKRQADAAQPAPQQEPVAWNEPTPDFYITALSRNTIKYTNAVWGKQDFSKEKRDECVVPVWFASPPQRKPWVGLTEQEAAECWTTSTLRTWQAIEAKLKEKNI